MLTDFVATHVTEGDVVLTDLNAVSRRLKCIPPTPTCRVRSSSRGPTRSHNANSFKNSSRSSCRGSACIWLTEQIGRGTPLAQLASCVSIAHVAVSSGVWWHDHINYLPPTERQAQFNLDEVDSRARRPLPSRPSRCPGDLSPRHDGIEPS